MISKDIKKVLAALFSDATDAELERARLLIKHSDVSDEVRDAVTALVTHTPETMDMELADMVVLPEVVTFMDSKIADAVKIETDKVTAETVKVTAAEDKVTAAAVAQKELLVDAIVTMATSLRKEINPLDLAPSQKTYRDTLLAMEDAEKLQAVYDGFKAEIDTLGIAPAATVTDPTSSTDGTHGKGNDDEPTSAPKPTVRSIQDVANVILSQTTEEKPA